MITRSTKPRTNIRGFKLLSLVWLGAALVGPTSPCRAAGYATEISWGRWTPAALDLTLFKARVSPDPGQQVALLSQAFLGTNYRKDTLIGSNHVPERLVVNLDQVDCLTFVEYIEALRLSPTVSDFADSVRNLRYRHGVVSYGERKHFFSDWRDDQERIRDVTASLDSLHVRRETIHLNMLQTLRYFLPGVAPRVRDLRYVSAQSILTASSNGKLFSGDYIGIGAESSYLDVTHVGIAVRSGSGEWRFRHASSRSTEHRVVDRTLASALQGAEKVLVLRPIIRP